MPQTPLPFHMTICGIEELTEHSDRPISHVLSILDPTEPTPKAFLSYGEHTRLELRFHDVIDLAPDQHAPQPHHVAQILQFGLGFPDAPDTASRILAHCHAGVSRSTAAMTLLLAQARPRMAAADVLARVVAVREKAWPNLRMLAMGEEQLGRNGEFTGAVASVYRRQLERQPHLKDLMIGWGRGREVALGLSERHPLE
jgi:predicted protein tyrosine phosphatase